MFKIPDWDESLPAPNLNFLKGNNEKKQKKTNEKITNGSCEIQNGDVGRLIRNPNLPLPQKQPKTIIKEPTLLNGKTNEKKVNNNKISSKKQLNNSVSKSKHINKCPKDKPLINPKTEKNNDVLQTNIKHNKRKSESDVSNHYKTTDELNDSMEMQNFDTEKIDEAILNAKKRKLNRVTHKEEEDVVETFKESGKTMSKEERKKQQIKKILEKNSTRNSYKVNGNNLRARMLERLKAAQFRYLNEKLYTSSGSDAKKIFDEDPNAFQTYHEGYQQQVKKWPVKPLDVIVNRIMKMPKSYLIADMGCGEGILSQRVPQQVRSFDLVSFNSNVEVCDIAHTPLLANSMNVAVYCLALMGNDLTQYIVEANRVLRNGGHLLIAEVESRFDDVDKFISDIQRIGFTLKKLDKSNNVFYFMEFTKVNDPPKRSKLPYLSLKPCFYKKR